MPHSPLLLLHIATGTLGMLSGFAAAFLRKGSQQHAWAGNMFVLSMMTLSSTGTYLALVKSQPGNVLGGASTFYLVTTAWLTARRSDRGTSVVDWSAMLFVFTLAAIEITLGTEAAMSPTGLKYDYPPGPYFFLGSVAVLATVGDIRMLARAGVSGTRRVARHLWRMCFALFIAAASIFMARAQVFPALLQKTGVLILLSFLPLILMVFWLVRVRYIKTFNNKPMPTMSQAHFMRPGNRIRVVA
jgi:hypothetical protein